MRTQTRLDIVNRALIKIGDARFQSETDATCDARMIEYDGLVSAELSVYPWHWATRTRQLSRLSADIVPGAPHPSRQWLHIFRLPPDMLGSPRAVFDRADADVPTTRYDLGIETVGASQEPVLYSDHPAIWLQYTQWVEPNFWPGYFAEAFVIALAGNFAFSVREDASLAAKFRAIAYGSDTSAGETALFGQARMIDAQAKPSAQLTGGASPLVAVRGPGAGARSWFR